MRYDPYRTLPQRAASNQGICTTAGCGKPRHGVSERCRVCLTNHRVHGHPHGRSIPNRAYERELMQAQRYIAEASDERTRANLSSIRAWLTGARNGADVTAHYEMARLARYGVEPARLLAEWIALYTYSRRNPRELPDDARLNFALANKTLRLAPREVVRTVRPPSKAWPERVYRMPPRADREHLGTFIRLRYVTYLAEVSAALDQKAATTSRHP